MTSKKETTELDDVVTEPEEYVSELNLPVWSLISFDRPVKSDLTYDEAADEMRRLNGESVSGLCIVTNEAAARFG